MVKHTIMGDKVHVYRRENNRFWQCPTFMQGKNHRTSKKEESLASAKEFAEDWYLTVRSKQRNGELITERTFKQAADAFQAEYEVITEGERSPKWVEGHKALISAPPASTLWKDGSIDRHIRCRSGLSR
jgi:hypothetical protein